MISFKGLYGKLAEASFGISGLISFVKKIDPTNTYEETIKVEVTGNMNSQKILLWQLALSIAFGKVVPFAASKIRPVAIISSYDVFGKRVACVLQYTYSNAFTAPYITESGLPAFTIGKPVLSNANTPSGALNINPPPPNNVIGVGFNSDLNYVQKQLDYLNFVNNTQLSGITRMYLGPGPAEIIQGGNWPAWSAAYAGQPLPEAGKIIATDQVASNPGPSYDTGSRDWLGVAIAAALAAYPKNIQHPVNLLYKQGAVPETIPIEAAQPLVNYPAVNPQSVTLPTTWPATVDPLQVNESDPNPLDIGDF